MSELTVVDQLENLAEYVDFSEISEEYTIPICEYAQELADNGEDFDFIVSRLEMLINQLKKSIALYSKGSVLARSLARKAFLQR